MVHFSGKTLTVNGKSLELEHAVADAFEIEDSIIVLFEADARRDEQFQNLIALRSNGEKGWIADLPTNDNSDVYLEVTSRVPLIANSWSCYACEIETATGRIKARSFTK